MISSMIKIFTRPLLFLCIFFTLNAYTEILSGNFSELTNSSSPGILITNFPDSSDTIYQQIYIGTDAAGSEINTSTYTGYYSGTLPTVVSISDYDLEADLNKQETNYRFFTAAFQEAGLYSLTVEQGEGDPVSAIYVSANSDTAYDKLDPTINLYAFSDDSGGEAATGPWTIYYNQATSDCTNVQFLIYEFDRDGSGLTGSYQVSGPGQISSTCSQLVGPSSSDTQLSMQSSAYSLRGVMEQQAAIINNGLNYDCTTYDKNGICLSTGGRVTDSNNPSAHSRGALLISSYRVNDNWRVGGYLDQNLSSNDPSGVNIDNNTPMGGIFAVWNQKNNGNSGYQVRVAVGFSDNDLTIRRTSIGTAEAGQGDSSVRSQAYLVTLSRAVQINQSRWFARPYVGVRYTKIERKGYTEDLSAAVATPLTYSGLSQEVTTALAGIRIYGQLTEKIKLMVRGGLESDVAHNTSDYKATGVNGLTSFSFNQNRRHIRPVAQAGLSYSIAPDQVVNVNLIYRQSTFNSSNSTTGLVTYEVGF